MAKQWLRMCMCVLLHDHKGSLAATAAQAPMLTLNASSSRSLCCLQGLCSWGMWGQGIADKHTAAGSGRPALEQEYTYTQTQRESHEHAACSVSGPHTRWAQSWCASQISLESRQFALLCTLDAWLQATALLQTPRQQAAVSLTCFPQGQQQLKGRPAAQAVSNNCILARCC